MESSEVCGAQPPHFLVIILWFNPTKPLWYFPPFGRQVRIPWYAVRQDWSLCCFGASSSVSWCYSTDGYS
ncbi:hypothetical protein G6F53_013567 [Rhizopus delemar]|nr:hypothetical protein G6F53_013567 [Rhizopus delemar]